MGIFHERWSWGIVLCCALLVAAGCASPAGGPGETSKGSISLDKGFMALEIGGHDTLTATANPADSEIVWESDTPTVATVDDSGNISALAIGYCTICARIKGSDTEANCFVSVKAKKLNVPQNLVVTSTATQIKVTWDAVAEAERYYVEYAVEGNTTFFARGNTTTTTYIDTNATFGIPFVYRVRAWNAVSEYSEYSATSSVGERTLAQPQNFTVSKGKTGEITLTWGAVDGATSYKVYRSETSSGSGSQIGTIYSLASYSDKSCIKNKAYYYYVQASVGDGNSLPSAHDWGYLNDTVNGTVCIQNNTIDNAVWLVAVYYSTDGGVNWSTTDISDNSGSSPFINPGETFYCITPLAPGTYKFKAQFYSDPTVMSDNIVVTGGQTKLMILQ